MLQLTVNGKKIELEGPCMLDKVLKELGHEGRQFAVAVDGDFVPRESHASYALEGGEALEVLSPMQGG